MSIKSIVSWIVGFALALFVICWKPIAHLLREAGPAGIPPVLTIAALLIAALMIAVLAKKRSWFSCKPGVTHALFAALLGVMIVPVFLCDTAKAADPEVAFREAVRAIVSTNTGGLATNLVTDANIRTNANIASSKLDLSAPTIGAATIQSNMTVGGVTTFAGSNVVFSGATFAGGSATQAVVVGYLKVQVPGGTNLMLKLFNTPGANP